MSHSEPTLGSVADGDRVRACMHMLRHIDDARELRKNLLAAPLFALGPVVTIPGSSTSRYALSTLRRLLSLAAEHLRTQSGRRIKPVQIDRQYAILIRCDVAGERPATVAADLGICMRQFYRERRSACAIIAPEIERLIREEVRQTVRVFDRFSMEFARAQTLRLAGSIDAAVSRLRSLLVQEPAIEKKTAVLASLVRILLEDSRVNDAQREIDTASSHCSFQSDSLEVLRALIRWASGVGKSDDDRDNRLIEALRALGKSSDVLSREFACSSLLSWSEHEALLGHFSLAQARLKEVDAIVARLAEPSPYLQVSLLLQTASYQYHVAQREDQAREHLDKLSRLAQRYGLIEAAADVLCGESSILQGSGNLERALQIAREAGRLCESGTAALPRARVLLRVSELEAAMGNAHRSLELSVAATKLLPPKGYQAMGARYETARAHQLLGNFAIASREAMKLYRDASRGGSGRLAGSALRLAAEAQSSAGKPKNVAEVIAEAIVLLERHGHAFSLCRAYEVSARVTGNREHARRAREIHALYRAG